MQSQSRNVLVVGVMPEFRNDILTPADVGVLVDEIIPLQLIREVEPAVRDLMTDFGNAQLSELGLSGSFGIVDARTIGFLSELSSTRIRSINITTRREIQLQLAEGVLAGEGQDAIARRIRAVFETASITRARLIARTEVNTAANFVRNKAMEEAGDLVKGRRWIATRDARTRRNHVALNGQIQPVGQPFRIPGTSKTAMFPGGFSDVGENVNCRCAIVAVVRKVRGDEPATIPVESDRKTIVAFDVLVAKWERILERALRRGFLAQERLILSMLRARDRPEA